MESGWPAPAVAEAAGVSVATVYVWWRRFRNEGPSGLGDRSCRPLPYVRAYDSNFERLAAPEAWLHWYNFHRKHTALSRRPPMDRLKKVCGNYT